MKEKREKEGGGGRGDDSKIGKSVLKIYAKMGEKSPRAKSLSLHSPSPHRTNTIKLFTTVINTAV
jgi:hypothetical protein